MPTKMTTNVSQILETSPLDLLDQNVIEQLMKYLSIDELITLWKVRQHESFLKPLMTTLTCRFCGQIKRYRGHTLLCQHCLKSGRCFCCGLIKSSHENPCFLSKLRPRGTGQVVSYVSDFFSD